MAELQGLDISTVHTPTRAGRAPQPPDQQAHAVPFWKPGPWRCLWGWSELKTQELGRGKGHRAGKDETKDS